MRSGCPIRGNRMLAGVLGIVGFVLALFVVGAFMENDLRKMAKYGAALAACLFVVLVATKPKPFAHVTDCYVDWDGRANSTVCD